MRIGITFAILIGLALITTLVAYQGFADVGRALFDSGWAVGMISVTFLAQIAVCAGGWRSFLGRHESIGFRSLIPIRWVRDAANTLLPVGRVGGDIAGARLLALRGARPRTAAATVVADKTVEVLAHFMVAVTGAGLLMLNEQRQEVVVWLVSGLVVSLAVLVAFVLAQRLGLLKLGERAAVALARKLGNDTAVSTSGVHDAVWAMYRNRRRVAGSMLFHLGSWTIGAFGTWLALAQMDHPVSYRDAFIIESVAQAIAGAGFLIPASLGIQEAGFMFVGTLVGVPAEVGLALSLVKRLADLLVCVPGLAYWKLVEGKRLWAAWTAD